MRTFNRIILVAFAVAALAAMGAPALAFHDEGVAQCAGCHTMHNSQNGALIDPDSPLGNAWLLKDATPSDVCLSCHATRSGAVFSATSTEKGAGNFIYLTLDNINDGHGGATNPITGDSAGHNLNAPGFGLSPDDVTFTTSPGGSFPASVLGCSSCHDPHGNPAFRMLYGAGRVVQDGVATFTNPAPDAEGLSLSGVEANDNHTAYKGGMSAWCGNCHGDFHNKADGRLEHPSGSAIGGTIQTNYNLYNGTSSPTGGTAATAYLSQVPFEDPAAAVTSTAGPSASSQVSCITCHRAHATSAMDAGRWDFNVGFLVEDGLESGSPALPNPFDNFQRSLCNKCHAKDAFDVLVDGTPAP